MYAPIAPFRTGYLPVSGGHRVYFEESGNREGVPVLFVHGGPGGATSPRQRQFFDPGFYRIVLMDQRGCGKSQPSAWLEENTTNNLISDIESLRVQLGVNRWLLFGGSWGSALALAYAETHPSRVSGLILRGIFMLRAHELAWFYQSGAGFIFPEAWSRFVAFIPVEERDNLVAAYHRRLTQSERRIQLEAAREWTRWEKSASYFIPSEEAVAEADDLDYSLAFARIETHYFVNGGFFEEGQLLRNIRCIRSVPAIIVQGRYDMVCPITTAWDLHVAWPEADFRVVECGGHSAFDPRVQDELVAATDQFREMLRS